MVVDSAAQHDSQRNQKNSETIFREYRPQTDEVSGWFLNDRELFGGMVKFTLKQDGLTGK